MDLLEFLMELDIQHYLELKNMISFTTGLDFIGVKSGITNVISRDYAEINVDSYDSFL